MDGQSMRGWLNRNTRFKTYRLCGLFFVVGLIVSCSSTHTDNQQRADPLESFNRTMFDFNYHVIDRYVVRPVAVAWRDYVPMPARNGLVNFFANLEEPVSMVNNFLLGDIHQGMKHFNRFFLNSVFGMAGLIDIASMANPKLVKQEPNRFGSTLGYYQVGYGPYVVLPGYGSFTLREDGGDWIDKAYPMLSYLTFWMLAGKWALEGIEKRAFLLNSDGILQNSSDPYLMIREAYFQNKDFKAQGGVLKQTINPNAAVVEEDLDSID
ncbi:MAG: phospholipid-binding lipoprotein MlaA [Candidatus Phlomobacter fragariae]